MKRVNTRLGVLSWRSLIRCCWTSSMEQLSTELRESDIVLGQFRRALKRIFGYWQSQRRVSVFFVRCVWTGVLTYLLTYHDVCGV